MGQRVHNSLFVVDISVVQLQHLHEQLARTIDPTADTVRTSPWCGHDQHATRHFGKPEHEPLPLKFDTFRT